MNREQKLWLLLALFGGISIIIPFNYKMELGMWIAIVGWITFLYSIIVFAFITAKLEDLRKPKPIKYVRFAIPKEDVDKLECPIDDLCYEVTPSGIVIKPKEDE